MAGSRASRRVASISFSGIGPRFIVRSRMRMTMIQCPSWLGLASSSNQCGGGPNPIFTFGDALADVRELILFQGHIGVYTISGFACETARWG